MKNLSIAQSFKPLIVYISTDPFQIGQFWDKVILAQQQSPSQRWQTRFYWLTAESVAEASRLSEEASRMGMWPTAFVVAMEGLPDVSQEGFEQTAARLDGPVAVELPFYAMNSESQFSEWGAAGCLLRDEFGADDVISLFANRNLGNGSAELSAS